LSNRKVKSIKKEYSCCMKRLFGTDGLRGEAGRFPLDARTAFIVGQSLAAHLREATGRAPRLITGRDTRESGGWLEASVCAGAQIGEAVCTSAGIITTPGVAFLTAAEDADAGIVISASHNPFQDNGIKIFTPSGRKLDDAIEQKIEAEIHRARETPADLGVMANEITDGAEARRLQARYLHHLRDTVASGFDCGGLRIVVDCANGAASKMAPELFNQLGAEVIAINNEPTGRNINLDCGSLHLEGLARQVQDSGAVIGIAFDGDADRALFCDANGEIVDGDATLWVLANRFAAAGALKDDTVVATVMSNLGLEAALATKGWRLLRTAVGDKYVLEELLRTGATIGGEQSGHIIFPRESLVGDGLRTAIHLLRAMSDTNLPLRELVSGFTRYPQILINVPVKEKRAFLDVERIALDAHRVERELGADGRLLLRYSGTESLARVMIEGRSANQIEKLATDLAGTIREELGV
jgi:phosphoglucosamine mutase